MKLTTKLLAVMAMLGLAATTVHATSYLNVSGVTEDVYTLDWNPGNALVQGGIPLSNNNPFMLYYQAKLGNFNGISGNPITANGGLNSNYEITVVAGFGETANVLTPTTSEFYLNPSTQQPNFFRMYFDTANNANNLAGTGFTDGTLIMSGHVTTSYGIFGVNTVNPNGPVVDLDQFGANDWVGTKTVSGGGGTTATVQVDSYTNYFTTPIDTLLIELFLNTSNILPYLQVDPSQQFTDAAGNLFNANVGSINGIYGPDMLFQADANSSPILTPEPSTMVLLGAGLFGLSVFARRRKNN